MLNVDEVERKKKYPSVNVRRADMFHRKPLLIIGMIYYKQFQFHTFSFTRRYKLKFGQVIYY